MKKTADLEGCWEEPGVRGTRVEISGNHLLILWLNRPVLDTTFTIKVRDDKTRQLRLKKTGLRYPNAAQDYATVTDLYIDGDTLVFQKDFPITGPNTEVLKKTENSRFGFVSIVDDEVLPRLKGVWKDTDGFYTLTFCRDTLDCNERRVKIHALRDRGGAPDNIRIVDQDPAHENLFDFFRLVYRDDALYASIMVCDAEPVEFRFTRP